MGSPINEFHDFIDATCRIDEADEEVKDVEDVLKPADKEKPADAPAEESEKPTEAAPAEKKPAGEPAEESERPAEESEKPAEDEKPAEAAPAEKKPAEAPAEAPADSSGSSGVEEAKADGKELFGKDYQRAVWADAAQNTLVQNVIDTAMSGDFIAMTELVNDYPGGANKLFKDLTETLLGNADATVEDADIVRLVLNGYRELHDQEAPAEEVVEESASEEELPSEEDQSSDFQNNSGQDAGVESDVEENKGVKLAELLQLSKNANGRYDTAWGDKTAKGLFLTIKRVLEESRASSDSILEADESCVSEASSFHTVQKTVNAGNKQRMKIKRFKTSDEMHAFLNKQSDNSCRESKHDLKSGTYVYAGGEYHNVKSLDPSALAHM